jgi:hypothetical protein
VGLNLKKLVRGLGKVLLRKYGTQIEQEAVAKIDRLDQIANTLIDKGAAKAKREIRKRIDKVQ